MPGRARSGLIPCRAGRNRVAARSGPGDADPVIEIEALTPDDWVVWRELRLAALAEAPKAFGARLADWVDAPEERWRDRLGLPGWSNLILRLGGRPSGMASGAPSDEEGVVDLLSVWVAPAARGAGTADHLISAVEHWAAERGDSVFRLSVRPDNARAIGFYRRYGFADTGHPGNALPDGRHELIFQKAVERAAHERGGIG